MAHSSRGKPSRLPTEAGLLLEVSVSSLALQERSPSDHEVPTAGLITENAVKLNVKQARFLALPLWSELFFDGLVLL